MKDVVEFSPVLDIQSLEDEAFDEYFKSTKTGVSFIPESYCGSTPILKANSGDFAKWLKSQHPELPIILPQSVPKLSLHSADVWLSLMYLASDTSMQVFLNMVASYLYDQTKGALKTDKPRVHISVIYQDKRYRKTKKFDFSGDRESLMKVIKLFDLNNFFDDDDA